MKNAPVISKVLDSLRGDLVSAERFFRLIPYCEMPTYKMAAAKFKKYYALLDIILTIEEEYIMREKNRRDYWQKLAEQRENSRARDRIRRKRLRDMKKENVIPLKDVVNE